MSDLILELFYPDDHREDKYPDMWAGVYQDGTIIYFADEDAACDFQKAANKGSR